MLLENKESLTKQSCGCYQIKQFWENTQIPAQWIDILTSLYPDFYFLVEGDGAAQKPSKFRRA